MVLRAKVLMAKGSHRIIDKSLRRSKNQHLSYITNNPIVQVHTQLCAPGEPSPALQRNNIHGGFDSEEHKKQLLSLQH